MRACIKVRLVCKIPIIAIPNLIETISDQATMFSYTAGCVANGSNVEYIRLNLLKLSSIANSTNTDNYYPPVITKISNFLFSIWYLLFGIVLRKITSPIKSECLPSCSSSSANNSFNLPYQ